ncbi:MAG: hypothetical protein ACT4OK_14270, partial [Gemmobacter sp.]
MTTVTLTLFRFPSVARRLWVFGQMALARPAMARMPEARFWKLCGSGTGEGFTPRPNWSVWAILVAWPDLDTARDRVAHAPVFRRWRARADESWTIYMAPVAVRGEWSRRQPFAVTAANAPAPGDAGDAPTPPTTPPGGEGGAAERGGATQARPAQAAPHPGAQA